MSEIRSVSVHLDADVASYIAKMKLAGDATDRAFSGSSRSITSTNRGLSTTATELDKVDAGAKKVATSSSRMGNEIDRSRVKVDAGLKSIDKFSGRLGILVSSLVAVGPAAVPIAAVAIPAVTALGGSVVALGLGVGVTELAFHGLGSTLEKFNKAAASPTATNIAAAQAAMDQLPPSAQRLVLQLHDLNPELAKLRQSAAAGFVPGVSAGLTSLVTDAPLANRAVKGISAELGHMAHQTGDALASDQWRPFIKFAGQEAPVALHVLGAATGDVAHGLAEILMAFGPLNRNVDAGILKLAQDFDRWASSLGKTKDFQSFVQYIETNGPRVVSLLGDTAQLFGDIIAAAAPLGGPTVQALDLIVKALDAIASSPLATPLLALAQLYSIMNLIGKASTGIGTSLSGGSGFGAKISTNAKTAVGGLFAVTSAADRARLSTSALAEQEAKQAAARRSTLIKGAALAAGIGIVASGAADKVGLTNTATLALAGSIAGPVGVAVGASIGLFTDWRSAVSDTNSEIRTLEQTTNSFDLSSANEQIAQLQSSLDAEHGAGIFSHLGDGIDLVVHQVTGGADIMDKKIQALGQSLDAVAENRAVLSAISGGFGVGSNTGGAGQDLVLTNQQLAQAASRAQPAMNALGISVKDLQDASRAGDGSLDHLVKQIVNWTNQADSAAGRSRAVSQAFADMSDETLTADQRISALTDSLSALIDPILNLGSAADTFHQGLNDIEKSLSKSNKSLRGNTDAAIQNRQAIRAQVSNLEAWIDSQAKAGASSGRMSATLRAGRAAIIAQGEAAGLNRQQILHMIDAMHLTPKLIKTVIQANTSQALGAVQSVKSALAGIDRVVNVHVNVTRFTNATLADVNTPAPKHADGGTIAGPRAPYGDKVLIAAAPGEEVISNRHGQADRFRADRAMGRIPAYANGGSVPPTHTSNVPAGRFREERLHLSHEAEGVRHRLHDLQIALKDSTQALDDDKQARQALIQKRSQLVSTVQGGFRNDIFAQPTSVWDKATNPFSVLRTDIRGARKYDNLIGRLRRRGLSGGALGEVTTLADAEQVARYNPQQLHALTRLYNERQRVSHTAGTTLGDARFGVAIEKATRVARAQAADVHRLTEQSTRLEHRLAGIEKAVKNVGPDQVKALHGATSTATRRARQR